MSGTTARFFERVAEWSRWKHVILEKYLRVWVYKLSSRHRELAFVDTCAGAGRYEDGSVGSPVIAARWNDPFLAQRGRRLVVIACEASPIGAASLRNELRQWMERVPPRAVVYEAPFEEVLPAILERTRRVPSFFFIDPFGMRSISTDKIRPLLEDRNRAATEVLVRADPVLFARFAGWLRESAAGGEKRQRTAAAFKVLLAQLNVDVDQLEREMQSTAGSPHRMKIFGQYLELFRSRFKYVQIVPIRESYFAAPKYYLIHGTDSPDGCTKLNDAVSTTEDELFEEHDAAVSLGQGSLFTPARPLRATQSDALSFAAELIQQRGPLRFVELCAQLAIRFGPDLREKHHRAAVKHLVDSGCVSSTTRAIEDASVLSWRTSGA